RLSAGNINVNGPARMTSKEARRCTITMGDGMARRSLDGGDGAKELRATLTDFYENLQKN
ncbi:unnamed protein product, partial [Amoebophrya sp. A25]